MTAFDIMLWIVKAMIFSFYRMRCLKDTGRVVPGEIEISAILVESTSLLEQSRVTSDEKTVGYKVSQIMNAYQVSKICFIIVLFL